MKLSKANKILFIILIVLTLILLGFITFLIIQIYKGEFVLVNKPVEVETESETETEVYDPTIPRESFKDYLKNSNVHVNLESETLRILEAQELRYRIYIDSENIDSNENELLQDFVIFNASGVGLDNYEVQSAALYLIENRSIETEMSSRLDDVLHNYELRSKDGYEVSYNETDTSYNIVRVNGYEVKYIAEKEKIGTAKLHGFIELDSNFCIYVSLYTYDRNEQITIDELVDIMKILVSSIKGVEGIEI